MDDVKAPRRATICLSMIVKNEAHVIERCLRSVRPYIDAWAIVDTGSTDGTQQRIRDFFREADLPGELQEHPWKDFAHNRNQALELARPRADYVLSIDADEQLAPALPDFSFGPLGGDGYYLVHEHVKSGTVYLRVTLVKSSLPWRWEGVLHEYLTCDRVGPLVTVPGAAVKGHYDSARNQDPEKYRKDADVLERALLQDPDNARYVLYLGQSYRDAQIYDKAIQAYERRSRMGGWDEETWYALYQVARLSEPVGLPVEAVTERFLRAFEFRPRRAETPWALAGYLRRQGRPAAAWSFAAAATQLAVPDDGLFLDLGVYRWRALDERAVAASRIGFLDEAVRLFQAMLDGPHLPAAERERVAANLASCKGALSRVRVEVPP